MTKGEELTVTETTTIKARFARMPIVDTTSRFLVQVMEPVPMVATIKTVTNSLLTSTVDGNTDEDKLKELLLKEWNDHIDQSTEEEKKKLPSWMKNVNGVELIECDLLVPKKDSHQPKTGPGTLK